MRIDAELAMTLAAVADAGSLEGGARVLHISQPAVTQRIQALERSVGQVLLVRSRPVRPTAAGERVIRYARQIQHLERDAVAALGVEPGSHTSVSIAINGDSLATWFLEPLAELAEQGDVTFELHRADEGRTAGLLTDGTVAAAVTTQAEAVSGCTVARLGEMSYEAFASASFASRWFPAGVTRAALEAAPVIDVDADDALQTRYLESFGADAGLPPRHRVPGSVELARALERGMGWAVLPAGLSGGMPQLVRLGGPSVTVPLYWQQWRVRSALLDRIAAAVAAAATRSLRTAGPRGA
ncbi:ArgP/LysG family DNA-binding transcriptional regulator [Demequina sp. TTPB684]|uniref:ArgP/LysG family DNA-binding transcriptional regulator n=1 Tax=unclassified Demequina TaxID=2620311 RepID=UPI001CF296DC|nr:MULTISPECIES: ArgP/LysG family DNA-binding transcriptional regulator [unclassified Demequina]MCB2411636.1 ArgP/LysG family DNA-binding transcriptional regulator [Demequina sp. TTPB684]UPU88603.1 ArgP/LysG family DNA-binding transcriptional regulator [Demequina sp. TMPB413]